MPTALDTNFLAPNASLLVALVVLLVVLAIAVGGLIWLVVALGRRTG